MKVRLAGQFMQAPALLLQACMWQRRSSGGHNQAGAAAVHAPGGSAGTSGVFCGGMGPAPCTPGRPIRSREGCTASACLGAQLCTGDSSSSSSPQTKPQCKSARIQRKHQSIEAAPCHAAVGSQRGRPCRRQCSGGTLGSWRGSAAWPLRRRLQPPSPRRAAGARGGTGARGDDQTDVH